ncbi:hypothetical protein KM043_010822 [Ampulex compressa]|nr:hypothetical protein KM043_010822 [Ampulex compressa]
MVNAPQVWPNSGTMTPAGSVVSVSLDSVSGFATESVLDLDRSKTPCKYEKFGMYNQETCLSMCKRAHVVEYCGCNPAFLFPTNSQRDCDVEDFLCLVDHNDVFNDYYVLTDEITDLEHRAMICDCPPECEYYQYNSQFTTVPIYESNNIILDVHFAGQTSFRYKTDIVITQMDLLVSFGGIIGLFLGGSLLSAAELIYYLMAAVFSYLRSNRGSGRKNATAPRPGGTWPITIQALPILDYGSVKPRSKKIPILGNCTPPKPSLNRY